MKRRRPRSEDFTVAWICALPVERVAAQHMLDEEYNIDGNFVLGRIGEHNVVIGCFPAGYMGTTPAAVIATQIESTFNNIQIRLLVGVGGGVPSDRTDVRLGDVVISQPDKGHGGVIQYDYGKTIAGGRLERTGFLNAPPKFLLEALTELRVRILSDSSKVWEHLKAFEKLPNFCRERAGHDILFTPGSVHVGGSTCDYCDKNMIVPRTQRQSRDPILHCGTIASGNQVMKDGVTRDRHSSELNVLCFEMEAAGIMNDFPCLVIRGICDYSDSHKNDSWQPYAATTAAACAKEMLSIIPAARGRMHGGSKQRSLFMMPFSRDKSFIGRDSILSAIEAQMKPTLLNEHRRTALVGLGGFGKSQIAIEFAYRIHSEANHMSIFWIHASNSHRFKQAYQEIAERANLPGRDHPEMNILQLVHRWLSDEASGAWLMILDNVDDDKTFFSTEDGQPLESFLPQALNGSILVTSRNSDAAANLVDNFGSVVELDTMSEEEALRLLETKVSSDGCENDAKELVRTLENIPLAIAQTAAYIKMRKRVTIRKYLQFFHENERRQVELLNNLNRDIRRDHSSRAPVLATWQITFDQIRADTPAATDLLALMSMYDRQGIPDFLIRGDMDDYQFDEALAPLLSFSIIREQVHDCTFEMHRLVQISMRTWLELHHDYWATLSRASELLADVFPMGESTTWPTCMKLLPHSREIFKQHEMAKPHVPGLALLRRRVAWYLLQKGELLQSEACLRQALKEYEETLGNQHLATLDSARMLAQVWHVLGRHIESETLFRRSVDGYTETAGPDDVDTLRCSVGLVHVLSDQGKYEEAEVLRKQTLERCKGLDNADELTLRCMNALAAIYYEKEQWSEAAALQTHILEARRRIGVEESHESLVYMRNLLEVRCRQNDWTMVEELGTKTLEISTRLLGVEHPKTLLIMNLLAEAYQGQGRWVDAEKMASEALQIQIRMPVSTHTRLKSQCALVQAYVGQGRLAEGQTLLAETTEAVMGSSDADGPGILSVVWDVATGYYSLGRPAEAIRLMEDCVIRYSRVYGPTNSYTQRCVAQLEQWKARAGNADPNDIVADHQ